MSFVVPSHADRDMSAGRPEGAYADPYVCGVAIGLVLVGAFAWTGRGLGASGAFGSVAASAVASVSAGAARESGYLSRYLGEPPWRDWLVWEIVGLIAGAIASAALAGRLRVETERGPGLTVGNRMWAALTGGAVMGSGDVLARGCTSGLALTGGAMLSDGAWLFMIAAFAAAFALAPVARRLWR